MTFAVWLAFATTQAIFAFTPGPAVLLVTAQGLSRGMAAGVRAALGVQAGNAVYLVLCSLGLGALLLAWPQAFVVLKAVGATYLVWLGATTIATAKGVVEHGDRSQMGWRGPFAQGFLKQLANPKSIIFFGALLPQFVTPGPDSWRQYAIFALTCAAVEIPVLAGYAWLGSRGGTLFASPGRQIWRERLSGAALILVGAWLFLSKIGEEAGRAMAGA